MQDPIEPGFRLQALYAVEGLLRMLRAAKDLYGDMDSLTVYMAVLAANAGMVSRDPELAARFGGPDPIPPEFMRPVSRQAVSHSTGLSRETTRRKIAELIEQGFLVVEVDGVRGNHTVLAERNNLEFTRLLVTEFLRTAERLNRAVLPAAPKPGPQG